MHRAISLSGFYHANATSLPVGVKTDYTESCPRGQDRRVTSEIRAVAILSRNMLGEGVSSQPRLGTHPPYPIYNNFVFFEN